MSFDIDGYADEQELDLLRIDGFDDCCLGVFERCGSAPVLCYSEDLIIEQLVREGASHEDAVEHYSFNIAGSWVGEASPGFLVVPLE